MSIIKNISNEKPFEVIPRELLQSCDKKRKDTNNKALSLEAIGLLCNLQSYPEGWELHKTELYNRYEKNGKSKVMRIWDELVEAGYIIQFKIRSGNNYEYHYYFSVYGITEEQIKEKEEYHQAKVQNKFKLDFRKSEVQKSEGNQDNLDFSNSEVQTGKSSLGSPKPEANIIHNQYNTHEDNTHEDNTHYNQEENSGSSSINNDLLNKLKKEFKIKLTDSYINSMLTLFNSFNKDIIEYAIEYSSENATDPKKYIKSVLKHWKENDIKTLQEAKDFKIKPQAINSKNLKSKELTPKWLEEKTREVSYEQKNYYNKVMQELREKITNQFKNEIDNNTRILNNMNNIITKKYYDWNIEERSLLNKNKNKFIEDQLQIFGEMCEFINKHAI
ncbi:DnaD domain protein [Staphylococcus xylosus]|uniref:DnaD domain protein n=1 Tax=Staphylococcus xylosus TaxID=1288 RepID=A0AAQ0RWY5_STAXY|nr:DnaD domain protein [Staphylococcus xylosus]RIM90995.1 DnaD domain protein [Staphylococcus xylosus]